MNNITPFDADMLDEHRRLLQMVFDRFTATGQWPNSRQLHVDYAHGDFYEEIEKIGQHLVYRRGEASQSKDCTILSIEGMAHCSGSDNLLSLFVRSLGASIKVYENDPLDPVVVEVDLQRILSIDEKESLCAMQLLFLGHNVWESASGSPSHLPIQLRLKPNVIRYRNVTNIGQYLELVRRDRPPQVYTQLVELKDNRVREALLKILSTLHPKILERCERLFVGEHYSESVEASFKIVKDCLRELTGFERGSDAFGKGGLYIRGAATSFQEKDYNKGVKFLLMAIDHFRNEKVHTSVGQIEDPLHAYEYLRLSSLAMRFLDRAEVRDETLDA